MNIYVSTQPLCSMQTIVKEEKKRKLLSIRVDWTLTGKSPFKYYIIHVIRSKLPVKAHC